MTTTLSSFDYNLAANEMHDILNNNNHNNNILLTNGDLKKHHQTVRFMSDMVNGKDNNFKAMATLAESEESIISKSSHEKYEYKDGYFEHV